MRIKERSELAAEPRERYRAAGKRERGELLDAFCLATGYERKYATKVLGGRRWRAPISRPRRRPVRYGVEFQETLQVAWEAAGHICAERLRPFLPDLVRLLQGHGHVEVDAETEGLLATASIAPDRDL